MLKLIIFSAFAPFLLSCSAAIFPPAEIHARNVVSHEMQSVGNSEPSEVKITLSTEKRMWNRNKPLTVEFSFENLSNDAVKLYPVVGFMLVRGDRKNRSL